MDRKRLKYLARSNRKTLAYAKIRSHDKAMRLPYTLICAAIMCFPVGVLSAQVFGLDTAWQRNVLALYFLATVLGMALLPVLVVYDLLKRRRLPRL